MKAIWASCSRCSRSPPPRPRRLCCRAAQGEAIGAEVSGSAALRHGPGTVAAPPDARLRGLPRRRRGDPRPAASYGLDGVEIISLPGRRHRSSTAPSARGPAGMRASPSLWEGGERIASWAEQPISLAQDSVSGRAEAELVDIGAGTDRERLSGQGRARPAGADLLAARGGRRTSPSAATAPRASSPGRRTSAPPGGARTRAWSAGAISATFSASIPPSPSWSRRRGRAAGRSGCGAARRCGCAPRSMPAEPRAPI